MTTAGHDGAGDRDDAVLDARAAELARATDDGAEERFIDVIPFTATGQAYAVPAAGVREVRRLQAVARIPGAPASLLGVTRVRSTVVPVFDLAALLGLDEPWASQSHWVLVLDGGHHPPLGLAADSVEGIRAQAVGDIQTEVGPTDLSLGVTIEGAIVVDVDALLNAPAVFESPPPAPVP